MVAAGLRLRGIFNDLWFDEIWSIDRMRQAGSPWAIFSTIHHDNNHYLNTLWLYCVGGDHGNWPGYRLFSLLAGVGSVAMAGLIARPRGWLAVAVTILVFGFSYLQILYASEARGYAPAVCFALSAFYCLRRSFERPGWAMGALFSLCEVLALASHLTAATLMAATLVWTVGHVSRAEARGAAAWARALVWHVPQWAFLGVLYIVDLRMMKIGGGSISNQSLIDAYGGALAWGMGASAAPSVQLVACALAVVVIGLGLALLRREGTGAAVFFAGVIAVFPLAAIVVRQSDFLYPRYFLLSVTFLLLLGSFVAAEAIGRGGRFRIVGWGCVAVFVAMNSLATLKLFADGRGAYRAAFQFAAETPSQGEELKITGNQDFRILLPLQFYAPAIATNRRVQYLSQEEWPATGADAVVFVRDSVQRHEGIPPQFGDRFGHTYKLAQVFPAGPLAGFDLAIYRRQR